MPTTTNNDNHHHHHTNHDNNNTNNDIDNKCRTILTIKVIYIYIYI